MTTDRRAILISIGLVSLLGITLVISYYGARFPISTTGRVSDDPKTSASSTQSSTTRVQGNSSQTTVSKTRGLDPKSFPGPCYNLTVDGSYYSDFDCKTNSLIYGGAQSAGGINGSSASSVLGAALSSGGLTEISPGLYSIDVGVNVVSGDIIITQPGVIFDGDKISSLILFSLVNVHNVSFVLTGTTVEGIGKSVFSIYESQDILIDGGNYIGLADHGNASVGKDQNSVVYQNGGRNISYENMVITGAGDEALFYGAIQIGDSGASTPVNISLSNIWNNYSTAVVVSSARDVSINGLYTGYGELWYWSDGLDIINDTYVNIDNVTASWNTSDGVAIENTLDSQVLEYVTITNCVFYDNGGPGISLGNDRGIEKNFVLRNDISYDNGRAHPSITYQASGFAVRAQNVTIIDSYGFDDHVLASDKTQTFGLAENATANYNTYSDDVFFGNTIQEYELVGPQSKAWNIMTIDPFLAGSGCLIRRHFDFCM